MRRLYVLVRDDLSTFSYKAVQAGHAVAQYMIEHPQSDWKNHYLIYLRVKDLEELERWERHLELQGVAFSKFCEPDIGNEPTAIATESDGRLFSSLKLL